MAAQMEDDSKKKKPKSNLFLGCFGFSRKVSDKKKKKKPNVSTSSQWFSWVGKEKKSTGKGDLIDVIGKEIQLAKSDKRRTAKRTLLSSHVRIGQAPAPVSDQAVHKSSNKKRCDSAPEIMTRERKSVLEPTTSQNGLTAATKTTKTTTTPEVNAKTVTATATVVLPQPMQRKAEVKGGGGGNSNKSSTTTNGKKVDSMVGMSVVMIILMIMLVWGKACAILCTSAWFYFVSRFGSVTNYAVSDDKESNRARESLFIDTDSEEYKKKVVLEGFLQRDHRNR